jgi:ribonuclease HI
MPWVEALLRGQRVFARAKADGSLLAEGGRVEIRYKPSDGRAYRASAGNLSVPPESKVLPDDACAPAEPVAKDGAQGGAGHATSSAESWIVYADGACSGNPGPAGAGIVIVPPGSKTMKEGFEYLGTGTNNIAELTAILRAVEAIPPGTGAVLVHTDSQYAIGVLTKGWKAKANQDLVARTKELVKARGVKLKYVPGHAGVPLNERADELAREAIRTQSSQRVAIT